MKKFILALAAVLCLGLTACGQTQGDASTSGSAAEPIGKYTAVIDIADYGTITLELDGDSAPLTVANFVKLAKDGFYDGLTFHRIMDGFMMQGGDPKGNGTGGSEETIPGEFSANGYDNPISHTRGTISMARASDPNSASSQLLHLPGGQHLPGRQLRRLRPRDGGHGRGGCHLCRRSAHGRQRHHPPGGPAHHQQHHHSGVSETAAGAPAAVFHAS